MAKLYRKADGSGFYIRKGYPVRRTGAGSDVLCRTMQVHERAEKYFEAARYRDGQIIKAEVFYALLLDGDISISGADRMRIRFGDLPSGIADFARSFSQSTTVERLLRNSDHVNCRYLIDHYNLVRRNSVADADSLAAQICLARHARQSAYELRNALANRYGKPRDPQIQESTKPTNQHAITAQCGPATFRPDAVPNVTCKCCGTSFEKKSHLLEMHLRKCQPQRFYAFIQSHFQ